MNKHTSGILVTLLSVLLLNLLLLSPGVRAQSGDEVLTNEEVMSMLKAGLSPTVIVNKIRTSKTRFNLSTNELIRLKQAGLNDEILQAMQGTSETPDNPTFSPASTSVRVTNDQNNPMAYHDVGIYGYSERGGTKRLSEMEPNVSTQSRTGGTLGTSVTYGIWPTKVKARIPGTSANFQVF